MRHTNNLWAHDAAAQFPADLIQIKANRVANRDQTNIIRQRRKPAATSSNVSRNTARPATSQTNTSSNDHNSKKADPAASVDTSDTSNNENEVENRRLRDEHQTAWIKFYAQSLTTVFLGQITTKLEDLAAVDPFMRWVPTHLTTVSPAQHAMFNLHLLDSVGPAFAFSDPDVMMVLSSRVLHINLALMNI
ncbi:hypothetical protein GGF31_007110 [Allomyces arbusculus]|nr:hypothetical protein GGF31_007110 [Allomyces arbusculus]